MPDFTSAFRLFAKYRSLRLKTADPQTSQKKILTRLVNSALNTRFGKDHSFGSIKDVKDYQKAVPLRKYEDFWRDYWEPAFPRLSDVTWPGIIPYFCLSSGTSTGNTKYLPYTREMIRSNSKAGTDLLVHHLNNRPGSRLFSGKTFVLGGSTKLTEFAPGIFGGDLSGIAAKTLPWWANYFYYPPLEMALIDDWEAKLDLLAKGALKEDIRALMGIPSWTLILVKKLREHANKPGAALTEIFPNLELLTHGGVNFEPYEAQFKELLPGSRAELREVYPASEGFIAVADRGYGDGLRLNCDHDIFFEFIPLGELDSKSPPRLWLKDVEPGVNYAIAVTTAAGLWSYIMGDTVKFVSLDPPRILITGRTSYYLSAFGEHLAAEEVEKAVGRAAKGCACGVNDYALGAIYPKSPSDLGGHLLVIEFSGAKPREEKFLTEFTESLCSANADYSAHFAGGFGLKRPEILAVPEGTFSRWMKSRGKLGGQNKVPRLIGDRELFQNLLNFARFESR